MINSVTVTNYVGDSAEIILSEIAPEHGFYISKIEGLGPPRATINMTEMVAMDGKRYNSAKTGERNIVLTIIFSDDISVEERRLLSYHYFPIKRPIELVFKTDNRLALIDGYVESNEPDIFSEREETSISIICPYPYFRSVDGNGHIVSEFSSIASLFEFPFENNSLSENLIEFSSIEKLTEKNIYYSGEVESGVTMHIFATGSVGDTIKVANNDSREVFTISNPLIKSVTGTSFGDKDEIIITTSPGKKKVQLLRNGRYYNIINCVGKDSDWFMLKNGDNIFSYTSSSGANNLWFRIESDLLYEGV